MATNSSYVSSPHAVVAHTRDVPSSCANVPHGTEFFNLPSIFLPLSVSPKMVEVASVSLIILSEEHVDKMGFLFCCKDANLWSPQRDAMYDVRPERFACREEETPLWSSTVQRWNLVVTCG